MTINFKPNRLSSRLQTIGSKLDRRQIYDDYGQLRLPNIFIHSPYQFNVADSLITNFHLPKTSLLIMVCAFAGYDLTMEAYKKAIKDKYRFFSYGDAMLVL